MKAMRIPALLISALVAITFEVKAFAEDAVCVFLSDKNNAWVIRRDTEGVKTSLNVGDAIYKGDTLVVTHGNRVQLAFDKEAQNVIDIEGDTTLQLSKINPTDIELKQGKVFALINKHTPDASFRVFAPTAIAAVRGTQFQVKAEGMTTQVMTYRGEVEVFGRAPNGEPTGDSVLVSAGQKTTVQQIGEAPALPTALNGDEIAKIDSVLTRVSETKTSLSDDKVTEWFGKTTGISDEKAIVPSEPKKASDEKDPLDESLKGKIIY